MPEINKEDYKDLLQQVVELDYQNVTNLLNSVTILTKMTEVLVPLLDTTLNAKLPGDPRTKDVLECIHLVSLQACKVDNGALALLDQLRVNCAYVESLEEEKH